MISVSDQCEIFTLKDYLQERARGSTLYGFKGGPAGIMSCKYVKLTADLIYPYRNQVRTSGFFNIFFINIYALQMVRMYW